MPCKIRAFDADYVSRSVDFGPRGYGVSSDWGASVGFPGIILWIEGIYRCIIDAWEMTAEGIGMVLRIPDPGTGSP